MTIIKEENICHLWHQLHNLGLCDYKLLIIIIISFVFSLWSQWLHTWPSISNPCPKAFWRCYNALLSCFRQWKMSRWHPHVGCIVIGSWFMPGHENDTVKEDQEEGCKILNEIESCALFFCFWVKFSDLVNIYNIKSLSWNNHTRFQAISWSAAPKPVPPNHHLHFQVFKIEIKI